MPAGPFLNSEFAAALRQTYPQLSAEPDDDALVAATLQVHPELKPYVITGSEGAPPPMQLPGPYAFHPPPAVPPEADPTPVQRRASAKTGGSVSTTAGEIRAGNRRQDESLAASYLKAPVQGTIRAAQGATALTKVAGRAATGVFPSLEEVGQPLADIAGGAMQAATVAIPGGLAEAPLQVGAGLLAGTAAGTAAGAGLEMVGAPPWAVELGSDAAGVATGVAAGHVAGAPARAAAQVAADAKTATAASESQAAWDLHAAESDATFMREAKEMEETTDAFNVATKHAQLNAAAQMLKSKPGSAFNFLNSLRDLMEQHDQAPSKLDFQPGGPPPAPDPLALPPSPADWTGAPPIDPILQDQLNSFAAVPPVPPSAVPKQLPEQAGPTAGRKPIIGAPADMNLDLVGSAPPMVAQASRPTPPPTIEDQLGNQLARSLEQAQPGQPRFSPTTQRVKLKEKADYQAVRATTLNDYVGQMEDLPHVRAKLVSDATTGEEYYVPATAGSDVYWNIVGKESNNPPTRKVITEVLKAYRDLGVEKGEEIPKDYPTPEGMGIRALRNAYDTWLPNVKKVIETATRRRWSQTQSEAARLKGIEDENQLHLQGQQGPPPAVEDQAIPPTEAEPDWMRELGDEGDRSVEGAYEPEEGIGAPPPPAAHGEEQPILPGALDFSRAPPVAELPPQHLQLTPPPEAPEAQRSLFERLKGEEGHLILNVRPGNKAGLTRWLADHADDYGDQPWHEAATDAMRKGDTRGAWRIAFTASARAGGVAAGQAAQKDDGAASAAAERAIAAHTRQIEKDLGRPLPDSVGVSPEGLVTFDFGGKGYDAVPAVKARATDLTLGKVFLQDLTAAADPTKILKIEGNEDPNLRVNAQIADQIVRDMPDSVLNPLLELTGIKDRVELGRQYRRAFSDAARKLATISHYVQENDQSFYHYAKVDESGAPSELGSVGALQGSGITTPEGFVKWLGGHATDAEMKDLEFSLPKGYDLKDTGGNLTPEAKTYARNWFRRQQRAFEIQKTIDTLANTASGQGIDRAIAAMTIAPEKDLAYNQGGRMSALFGLSKAALIAKPSTMIRNTWSQAGRYTAGIVDDAIAAGFSLMTGNVDQAGKYLHEAQNLTRGFTRQGTGTTNLLKHPASDGLQAIYDYTSDRISGLESSDARKLLSMLSEFPHQEAKFLGSLALEGDMPSGQTKAAGRFKGVKAAIDKITAPEVRNTLTVLNRVQEFHFRGAVFDSMLRTQLEAKGIDPEVALARGQDPKELIAKVGHEEMDRMIGAATSTALDYTFAANPMPGTAPDYLLRTFTKIPVVSHALQLGMPFPRFNFVSAPRWLWDHFPMMPLPDLLLHGFNTLFRSESGSPIFRGRFSQMRQMQAQEGILKQLDAEIGRTDYDASKHLGDFMAAKGPAANARGALKSLGQNEASELPDLEGDLGEVRAGHESTTDAADAAKAKWREAEARLGNLKSQRETARKTYAGLQGVGAARSQSEYFARALGTGTAAFTAAYLLRRSPGADGTRWYEYNIKVPDLPGMPGGPTKVDLRPYAPEVQPLLTADLVADIEDYTDWDSIKQEIQESPTKMADLHYWEQAMQQHYTGKYTSQEFVKDAMEAYLSVSPAAGSTRDLQDILTGRMAENQKVLGPGAVQSALLSVLGQFVARYTNPLGFINDVRGQFDEDAAKARIPTEGTPEQSSKLRSLVDPTIANIPFAREALIPEKVSPLTGEAIQTKDPIARALAGVNQRTQTQVEAEINNTGLPYGAAVPRVTGDREFDNAVAKHYAGLINDYFPQVLASQEYQGLTPELKRDILSTKVFPRLKKAAYGMTLEGMGEEEAKSHLLSPARKQKMARWEAYSKSLLKDPDAQGPEDPPEPEPPESPGRQP